MRPADYPTAWSHPPTRRSWFYHLITTGLRFLGWIAVWISSLGFLVSFLSPVYSFLFIPALIYSAFRAVLQLAYIRPSLYIRRVLQQYPWQLLTGVPRGRNKHPAVQEDEMWLELPNPERPDERIPCFSCRACAPSGGCDGSVPPARSLN